MPALTSLRDVTLAMLETYADALPDMEYRRVRHVVTENDRVLQMAAALESGDLETAGSLRIDGKLEGNVRRADTVVIGVGASMTGDVHAREVVIGGTIIGNVHATERVELQATAIVTGDIVTQTILVQEGGVVNGRVLMRPPGDVTSSATLHVSDGATSSR